MARKDFEFETVGELHKWLGRLDPKQALVNSFAEPLRVSEGLEDYDGAVVFEPEEEI